jgi:hypothetical protein
MGLLAGVLAACGAHAQAPQVPICNVNFHISMFNDVNRIAVVNGTIASQDNSISVSVSVNINDADKVKVSDTLKNARRLSKAFLLNVKRADLASAYLSPGSGTYLLSPKPTSGSTVNLQSILVAYTVSGNPTNDELLDRVLNQAADRLHEIAPCIREE